MATNTSTSNAITAGFARYVVIVVSASARDADSFVSIVDAVVVLGALLEELVLEELDEEGKLLVLGSGGGVLLVKLDPLEPCGGKVLLVVFTLGGPSTISSIGVDKPKTVTLPTYTPGSLGALNLTSEVVPLAPGGMMMLNV